MLSKGCLFKFPFSISYRLLTYYPIDFHHNNFQIERKKDRLTWRRRWRRRGRKVSGERKRGRRWGRRKIEPGKNPKCEEGEGEGEDQELLGKKRERESWEVDMKVKVKRRMIAIWMKFTASLVSRETEWEGKKLIEVSQCQGQWFIIQH